MSSPVLVVIGSGPGIGLSTASIFASQRFDKIALISRNTARLAEDREAVLKAAGREVEVATFTQDVAETSSFQKTLEKIEKLGVVSCVFFNAARVHPSDLVAYEEKEVAKDFMVCRLQSSTSTTVQNWINSDLCFRALIMGTHQEFLWG